jgi:hypothetical protein
MDECKCDGDMHHGILFSLEKKRNPDTFSNTEEPWIDEFTQVKYSSTKGQISSDSTNLQH